MEGFRWFTLGAVISGCFVYGCGGSGSPASGSAVSADGESATAALEKRVSALETKVERLSQPYLGFQYTQVQYSKDSQAQGHAGYLEVGEVDPFSNARIAGIRVCDQVMRIGGKSVGTVEERDAAFSLLKVGERVEVEVKRGREIQRFQVLVGCKYQFDRVESSAWTYKGIEGK